MDFFKEYLPFLSVCVIISGLLYQMIYYYNFGVEIQYYITVSELFLVLCNKVAYMFFIPLMTVLMVYAKFDINIQLVWVTVGLGVFSILLISVVHFDIFYIVAFAFLTIALIYPYLVKGFRSPSNSSTDIKLINRFIYVISTVLYFAVFVMLQANRDINKTEKGNYIGTTIVTKDSTYISDKNHYFIGKTANFYFILNKEKDNSSVLVLPERDVTKFMLKTSRLHYFF